MSRLRAPIASNVTTLEPPRASASARAEEGRTSSRTTPQPERPGRRRGFRLARIAVAGVVIVASLAVAGRWVLRLPYFSVEHVTVVGVHHEPLAQVLAASGLDAHPPMIDVSSDSVGQHLARFTWISGVTVIKHWPNTVVVQVRENTAVAVAFTTRHALQYVDALGRDLGPAPLHANLPTLEYTGTTGPAWPFQRAGVAAAFVASQLPVAFSSQVSVISVDHTGAVTLRMTTPVSFVLGPVTQLHEKFIAIASVIARSTLHAGDVVDVSVPSELSVTGPAPSDEPPI